ncbi:MAG: single-stranded-DNA-specific exonuclease RecJ, partial [Anaerolineae bacterium]|nr:single-stranded-DNA-specific exonuclease RecJ [Anaerolineae bacterium]
MPPKSKRWNVKSAKSPVPPAVQSRLRGLSSSPIVAQVLYNRGLADPELARAFLRGELRLHDPFLLRDLPEAVSRIRQAIRRGESIAVYGDFDADGVTATVLLVQALRALDGKVQPYIPDRVDEGYGLNEQALGKLAGQGVGLVITVDSGIRSVDEALYARQRGLDLIITDHHFPAHEMPEALAVVNPKRPDCPYPFKELSGVGLAFKLAQALLQSEKDEEELLDLVALGTVADIAPLRDENRTLVQKGLARLNALARPGVRALLKSASIVPGKVDATAIGFMLGPRLNAAGRLESAMIAYDLLSAPDLSQAEPLAQKVNSLNRERQELTAHAVEEAKAQIEATPGHGLILFAGGEQFRAGIVGLVAGRLADEYHRPAIVMENSPETTRGSARSIPEFHITSALDECRDLLVRHGGHAAAAGFTVRNDNLPALKERLLDVAASRLRDQELVPTLDVDAEVRFSDLTMDVQRDLARLEPCGDENPVPLLCARNVRVVEARAVGSDSKHLKLTLSDGTRRFDAI